MRYNFRKPAERFFAADSCPPIRRNSPGKRSQMRFFLLLCAGLLSFFPDVPALGQSSDIDGSAPSDGINSGNYAIRQIVEFGYRFGT
jgi:hypothetical protein